VKVVPSCPIVPFKCSSFALGALELEPASLPVVPVCPLDAVPAVEASPCPVAPLWAAAPDDPDCDEELLSWAKAETDSPTAIANNTVANLFIVSPRALIRAIFRVGCSPRGLLCLDFQYVQEEIFSVWPFAAELSESAWVAARPEN
jgi:hypothetical protein